MPRSPAFPPDSAAVLDQAARKLKAPLHVQIKGSLRTIIDHEFKDGDRFYTERDLVKHLGASLLTVRRALGDLTSEGLLERQVGRGTFVRKRGPLKSVGVFLPAYNSQFFMEMLEELATAARTIRARLNVYHTHKDEAVADALSFLACPPSEEGILLLGNTAQVNTALYDGLAGRGYRTVVLNNRISGLNAPSVGIDDRRTVEMGLEYLRKLGHRNMIFLVNEPMEGAGIQARYEAARAWFEHHPAAAGVIFGCDTKPYQDSHDSAFARLDEIFARPPGPTAIFATSDNGALAVLRYCTLHRIKVPDELSVLGFIDSGSSRFSQPALSSFSHPLKEIARRAVEMLAEGATAETKIVLPPKLIVRESTAPARR